MVMELFVVEGLFEVCVGVGIFVLNVVVYLVVL